MQHNGVPHYGAYFQQTLKENGSTPANGKYAGRKIREGYGDWHDYCHEWFQGSYILPMPAPGPNWDVYSDNTYGPDYLLATADWISYYSLNAESTCWMEAYQAMSINSCANPDDFIPYDWHVNAWGVLAPNQWIYGVQRGTVWGHHSWPW